MKKRIKKQNVLIKYLNNLNIIKNLFRMHSNLFKRLHTKGLDSITGLESFSFSWKIQFAYIIGDYYDLYPIYN